jgi:topoisomerase IV subunit A
MVETVADEPVTVILSRNGFLRSRSGHGIDRSALIWKEGDAELAIHETRTTHPIVLFGANGRVFNVRAAELPGGKGDGVPASSLVDTQGAAIVGMLAAPADAAVIMGTSGGNALRARIENFVTRQRAGKQFVTLDEGEALLAPSLIAGGALEAAALSAEGRLLVFPLEEIKELPSGGRGVMAIRLHEGEAMLGLRAILDSVKVAAIGRGEKRITIVIDKALEHYRGSRARTGRVLQPSFKRVEALE